jgi:hypothetical protein
LSLFAWAALGAAKSNRPSAAPASALPATSAAAQEQRIWVGKSDSAQSCNVNSGISLDKMGADLNRAGIKYVEHKKMPDDKMHIQMCGADKGTMNIYSISKDDLPKALGLGFAEVKLQQ